MTRIALIDDDPMLVDLMQEVLAEEGWETVSLTSAKAVVSTLVQEVADVILLDIRLNGTETGWSVLHSLREHPLLRHIPVVILSGDTKSMRDKADWLTRQGIGVLPKPFDLDDLFAAVNGALEGTPRMSSTETS